MEASRRRPRGYSFVRDISLAIAASLVLASAAHAACVTDVDCANTPNCANDQPGQVQMLSAGSAQAISVSPPIEVSAERP